MANLIELYPLSRSSQQLHSLRSGEVFSSCSYYVFYGPCHYVDNIFPSDDHTDIQHVCLNHHNVKHFDDKQYHPQPNAWNDQRGDNIIPPHDHADIQHIYDNLYSVKHFDDKQQCHCQHNASIDECFQLFQWHNERADNEQHDRYSAS